MSKEIHGIHKLNHPAGKVRSCGSFDITIPMPEGVSLPENAHVSVTVVGEGGYGTWINVKSVEEKSIIVSFEKPKLVELCPVTRYVRKGKIAIHWVVRFEPGNVTQS